VAKVRAASVPNIRVSIATRISDSTSLTPNAQCGQSRPTYRSLGLKFYYSHCSGERAQRLVWQPHKSTHALRHRGQSINIVRLFDTHLFTGLDRRSSKDVVSPCFDVCLPGVSSCSGAKGTSKQGKWRRQLRTREKATVALCPYCSGTIRDEVDPGAECSHNGHSLVC